MWQDIKNFYWYIHSTFHSSEVILWSRLQIMVATVWVGLQGVDMSPVIKDPKYMFYYIIFSNVVNELLRRRNADRPSDWNASK